MCYSRPADEPISVVRYVRAVNIGVRELSEMPRNSGAIADVPASGCGRQAAFVLRGSGCRCCGDGECMIGVREMNRLLSVDLVRLCVCCCVARLLLLGDVMTEA